MYKLIWRFVAVICMLAWGIVLIYYIDLYVHGYRVRPGEFFTPFMKILFCSATILILGALVVVPLKFGLYAILCCFWGLCNLIDCGSSIGILMYMLGIAFAFHSSFFIKHREIKIIIVVLLPIFALISQARFGSEKVIISFLQVLFVALIFGLASLLFFSDIRRHRKNAMKKTNTLYLPAEHFSARDIRCLKKIQDGEKYESIAKDEDIGLSTLKNKMKIIYRRLEVCDKTSFMSTYAGYNFLLKSTSKTSFSHLNDDQNDQNVDKMEDLPNKTFLDSNETKI